MQPIVITRENFATEVVQAKRPILLDFWAPWCGPCNMIAPIIDELAKEIDYAGVGKVNVDDEPEIAAAFGARSIPLLAVVKDGAVVNQVLGAVSKDAILEMLAPFKQN